VTTVTSTRPISPALGADWRAELCDRLALVTLALLAVIAAFTFQDYGLGWDDYTHSQYGDLLLSLYGSGFTDRRALSFVNLYMYGGGFDMVAALAAKILPFDLFETRRLIGAVIGLIGIAVTWRLARRLGGPLAGLIALVMLATTPMFYGHMFMNPKDAPFAVAISIFLLALVRIIDEYPAPSRAGVVLFGAVLGLTIGTRILGLIAALFVLPALLLLILDGARRDGLRTAALQFGRWLLLLSPALLVGYLVMGLLWPWSVVEPLNPVYAVGYFAHFFEKPWKEMYGGTLVLVPDMPASYVPRLLVLKLQETLLVLGFGGIIGTLIAVSRRDLPVRWRAALLMMVCAAIVPIVYAMISRPALYNGLRHFNFIVPPLTVIAGLAGAWTVQWLRKRSRALLFVSVTLFGFGVSVSIADMVRLHPYQYAHVNWLAGGVRGADLNYMLDYWGLAFKQATDELRVYLKQKQEKPPAGRGYWVVAVCGPQRVAQVELGPKFHTTADPRGADFALMLGEFYCREIKGAPIVHQVVRDGVVFATVYDIRGRAVGDLLTMPPP
jgi:Dolichyl-phosphate-mannose-protein mannosyltransferase